MRRRHLSIFALLVALFAGAWGQVFAASCPHTGQEHACCRARAVHNHPSRKTDCGASHGMSDGMPMTPAAESDAEPNQGAGAFAAAGDSEGNVTETCDHCASRQPVPPQVVASSAPESGNRNSELAPPVAISRLSELTRAYIPSILSRDNSPPEASTARHILVNVFRI
jgi:hypothetical protein